MGFHHPAHRLMQNQVSEVELHDAMQSRRKILEELLELSVRGNRFRNLKQSLVLTVQKIHLFLFNRIVFHGLRV